MSELTLCLGATGAQGGSVVRALLSQGRPVRALTRDPRGAAAEALRARGVQVVAGDLSDLGSLTQAMRGCANVFGVTAYWEHFGCEVVHGKNLVDAAVESGVKHLVLSTLPSAEGLSGGAIAVPHLDSKAAIERYARCAPVPATFVHVAFYYENFLSWFVPQREDDGALWLRLPQGDTPLAGVAIEDVGEVVARLLAEGPRDEVVGVVGDDLPVAQYAAAMGAALGRAVRYAHVDAEDFAALPFPGADDLAAMFDLNRRFIPSRAADVAITRTLHPRALGFAAWAQRNAPALQAVCG